MKNNQNTSSQDVSTNDRSSRLREVLRYAGYAYGVKSARSFAASVGVTQRMMAFYLKGDTQPSRDCCEKVCNVYKDFYFDWLYNGDGPKYNPEYVKVNDISDPDFNNPPKEEKKEDAPSLDSALRIYLSSIKRRIMKAIDCPTQDELKQRLLDIVEELEDTGK